MPSPSYADRARFSTSITTTTTPAIAVPAIALSRALAGGHAVKGKPINKINVRTIGIDQFPQNLIDMQNYDAVVLGNVPRGQGGLTPEQDVMLSQYVHDMGGGVAMLGGDESFGAGGWQGSELEKVLPVDMDIPAQRQVGKGALVLVMHSCEMPNGNYWGVQCAKQAIKTLSDHDEVGIISYSWNGAGGGGGGIGGASWDFALQEKGDGSAVNAAADKMQLGDMPSFDDSMNLALNGVNNGYSLAKSNARHKHVIIISDGDPQAPPQGALDGANTRPPRSASRPSRFIRMEPERARRSWKTFPTQLARRPAYGPDRIQSQPASADFHQGSDHRPAKPDSRRRRRAFPSSWWMDQTRLPRRLPGNSRLLFMAWC